MRGLFFARLVTNCRMYFDTIKSCGIKCMKGERTGANASIPNDVTYDLILPWEVGRSFTRYFRSLAKHSRSTTEVTSDWLEPAKSMMPLSQQLYVRFSVDSRFSARLCSLSHNVSEEPSCR